MPERKTSVRNCLYCNIEFTSKGPHGVYCSAYCRVTDYRKKQKENPVKKEDKPLKPEFIPVNNAAPPPNVERIAVPKNPTGSIIATFDGPAIDLEGEELKRLNTYLLFYAKKLYAATGENKPMFMKIMDREISKLQINTSIDNHDLRPESTTPKPGSLSWALRQK